MLAVTQVIAEADGDDAQVLHTKYAELADKYEHLLALLTGALISPHLREAAEYGRLVLELKTLGTASITQCLQPVFTLV